jgi:hypothetical protein
MIVPFAFVILVSPFDLIEASIDRTVLPREVRSVLDPIGVYTLKDGKNDRLVLLYIHDSDWVTAKANMKKGTALPTIWPNGIQVHAVYQDKTGKWTRRELLTFSQFHFTRIVKVAPDHILLEFRPATVHPLIQQIEKRILFVDGGLIAK